jgi:hypothetical protein
MLDESVASGVGPVGREHGAGGLHLLGAEPHVPGTRFGVYANTASKCSVRFYMPDGAIISTHAMELVDRAGSSRNRHGGYYFANVPSTGFVSMPSMPSSILRRCTSCGKWP